MGQIRVLDERLVGRIKQDQGTVLTGVINPGLQLRFGGDGTRGVVGEAEIDQVNRLVGICAVKSLAALIGR